MPQGAAARSWKQVRASGSSCTPLGAAARSWEQLHTTGSSCALLGAAASSWKQLRAMWSSCTLQDSREQLRALWSSCTLRGAAARSLERLLGTAGRAAPSATCQETQSSPKPGSTESGQIWSQTVFKINQIQAQTLGAHNLVRSDHKPYSKPRRSRPRP